MTNAVYGFRCSGVFADHRSTERKISRAFELFNRGELLILISRAGVSSRQSGIKYLHLLFRVFLGILSRHVIGCGFCLMRR